MRWHSTGQVIISPLHGRAEIKTPRSRYHKMYKQIEVWTKEND